MPSCPVSPQETQDRLAQGPIKLPTELNPISPATCSRPHRRPLSPPAATGTVLDFQDILQRFAFDNICKIAFGFDPAYLLPSLPQTKFAHAFEESVIISSDRFKAVIPLVWKIKKLLNIGSEKRLRIAVSEVQQFANNVIREKKGELIEKSSLESECA
jgi:hypothetical protein